ncbi:MAG: hypothetical protein R6W06_14125 [Prochlorococcaceae cyanobacterium]
MIQQEAARTLIESGQALFSPKTMALELEWVLWGYDRFNRQHVGLVFDTLLDLPSLQLEDRGANPARELNLQPRLITPR